MEACTWRSRCTAPIVALVVLAGGGAAALVVTTASDAGALTSLSVTSNADTTGAGTLRSALTTANGTADDVEIDVQADLDPITLSSALPVYTGGGGNHDLTIVGNGVTINGFTGATTLGSSGTGLLTIDGVTINGGGDGVLAEDVAVTNSTINDAGVVGINAGHATVTNTTIAGSADDGIASQGGVVTVTNSTLTGNVDAAINADNVTVTNSTISGNPDDGIDAENVTLVYADVVQNGGSDGTRNVAAEGNLTSFASVIAGAGAGNSNSAIGGVKTSTGWNFADDTTCGFDQSTDHQADGADPMLGDLAANGGSTETLLPQTGSPLIDAIPNAACQTGSAAGVTTDQRGLPRPEQASGLCDIGAVEVQLPPPPAPTPAPTPAPAVVVTPLFTG